MQAFRSVIKTSYKPQRFLNLHEYQAAQLLNKYKVPVLLGHPAFTLEEAKNVAQQIEDSMDKKIGLVLKSQVHAGGRGRGVFTESGLKGGVHLVKTVDEIVKLAPQMLGNTLVTKQSGAAGKPCNALYIVEQVKMTRELYVAILLDRTAACPVLICSARGGMGIEEVDPKYIKKFNIDPSTGISDQIVNDAVAAFELPEAQRADAEATIRGLYNVFKETDSTMVEVNPFAVLEDGRVLVCDTKVKCDDNAAFRHQELFAMDDLSQKDAREVEAESHDLNYVKLKGSVGCMVNGAGLAMATMDYIKFAGGSPANFLDVGGGSTVDRVFQAVSLINSDPDVKAILVNIFGGIVRCDVIVEGLVKAMKEFEMDKPIVMRIKGTNAELAEQMVKDSGMEMYFEKSLDDAIKRVVGLAGP